MNAITKIANRIKNIPLKALLAKSLMDTKEQIADAQREQLLDGKLSTGKDIKRKYRNPRYARFKQSKNPRPSAGTPDLNLTGRFHNSITVSIFGESVSFRASDKKTPDLEVKYSNDIFGLNDESLETFFKEHLRDALILNIRKYLNA